MKKISALLIVISFVFIYSCDDVDGPFKENPVVSDYCKTGIADSVTHKKVLAEDYTGHLCGNCPDAGVYLNDTLKQTYGHCLVVVSVHAGFFAHVCPNAPCPGNQPAGSFLANYSSTVGEDWNTFFGITGNPKGMVDRIGYPGGTHSKAYSAWAPAIASELTKQATAKLQINNSYNSLTRNLSSTIQSDFLSNLTGDYKLQVVLTEDSIIDWQEWYNHTPEYVPDYVHHHVLRDALNSSWGETIAAGSAAVGTSVTKNYSYTVNNNWNADYCYVVAFIYNNTSKEIIQVEEAKIR